MKKFKEGVRVKINNSGEIGRFVKYETSRTLNPKTGNIDYINFCMVDLGYICNFPYYEHELTLINQ